MKKFLVVLLALAMVFGLGSVAFAADTQIADYTDLAGVPAEQQAAIYRLTALGVLAGDGIGGDFRPEDTITRAEFAKIAIYLAGKADAVDLYASFAPAFADVQDGTWYEGYVNAAVAFGYMKGYADDTFKPGQTVTMQEVATVLLRIAGYTDALKGEWPNDYIRKANDTEIIAYVDFVGPKAATRAEVASLANETLDLKMVAEVENEVAAGLGFVGGTVDEDGFTYIEDKTNEGMIFGQDRYDYNFVTVLEYAFDMYTADVIFELEDVTATKLIEVLGWHFEDYANGELKFDFDYVWNEAIEEYVAGTYAAELASDYYLFGADLFSVAGHQATLTFTVDDDELDEVYFTEITSERVAYDKYEEEDGDVEYDGETYKSAKVDTDYLGTVDGDYGYIFLNKDGKLYAGLDIEAIEWTVDWNLVKEVEEEEIIVKLDGELGDIDFDKYAILIIKDGEFVDPADLDKNDVITYVGVTVDEDDDDLYTYVVTTIAEGEVNKLKSNDKAYIVIDDVTYNYVNNTDEAAALYSKDSADKKFMSLYDDLDEDFGYKTLYKDNLEEVVYIPGYAWQTVELIGADVAVDDEIYAIVLGYELERGINTTYEDSVVIEDTEDIVGVIVLDENGEERTIEFKDTKKMLAEHKYTYAIMGYTGVAVDFPEPGDAVILTLNSKEQAIAMTLVMEYSVDAYDEIDDRDATLTGGPLEISAKGRFEALGDVFTVTDETIIAAIYSEDVDAITYDWDCFDKAEILDVEDLKGVEITDTYAWAEASNGRYLDYVYLVNPEIEGGKGDYELAIADEHYQKKGVEYIVLDDGTMLPIDEDAEDKFFDKFEDSTLYPMVVAYTLAGEYLTDCEAIDGSSVDVAKGQMIALITPNDYHDELQALLRKVMDDKDLVVDVDTATAYDTENGEYEVVCTNDTYYVPTDLDVVDLTGDTVDYINAKAAAKDSIKNDTRIIFVIADDHEVVAAYLINKGI